MLATTRLQYHQKEERYQSKSKAGETCKGVMATTLTIPSEEKGERERESKAGETARECDDRRDT